MKKIIQSIIEQNPQLNLFTEEERDIINNAYSKFEPYLKSLKMNVKDLRFDPKKWGK